MEQPPRQDEPTADRPIPFGYKTGWMAVRSEDTQAIVDTLGLKEPRPCNWEDGVERAYGGGFAVFVTPPIRGWTLVVGLGLEPDPAAPDSYGPLNGVSARFGEAQYFGSHRVVDYHCWAKSVGGELQRHYSALGEQGLYPQHEFGVETPQEKELGFRFFDHREADNDGESYWEREDREHPDEEHVMRVAELWSVDPTQLDEGSAPPALGVLGNFVVLAR